MSKLHELIAVAGDLKKQAAVAESDLKNTFEKKAHHFSETQQTFLGNGENDTPVVESRLDLQTTVKKEISWIKEFLVKSYDADHQIAMANCIAKGDVVLEDGTVLLENIPATSLLSLETRLSKLQEFIMSIPTLDPAKGFQLDADRGEGIYKARTVTAPRTKKINKPLELAKATDKHPAQVQLVTEDVSIGTITKMEWSGLITTAAKGKLIEKVEDLSRAVKKARSRANETPVDVVKDRIGAKVLGYVFDAL